jgi:hypothetical protein
MLYQQQRRLGAAINAFNLDFGHNLTALNEPKPEAYRGLGFYIHDSSRLRSIQPNQEGHGVMLGLP